MSSSNQLGQILVQKGYITQQQLDGAVAAQGEQQLGQVLIGWNWITQEQLMYALNIQAPPPPPPSGGPDLTMDNLQTSKFKIDLKTMIYVGSLLVSGITMYFTFMAELDARFAALEGNDKDLMVEIDKRLTDLENTFTPIGDGVYTVDPNSTWPPSRGEYKMKDEMSRNKILVLEETIDRLEKELEKLEEDLDDKVDKP